MRYHPPGGVRGNIFASLEEEKLQNKEMPASRKKKGRNAAQKVEKMKGGEAGERLPLESLIWGEKLSNLRVTD